MGTYHSSRMIHSGFCLYCCRLDAQLTFLEGREDLRRLLGYHGTEAVYADLSQYVCGDWKDGMHIELEQQLLEGDEIELVFPVTCENGEILWLLNRGKRFIEDGEGYISGVLVDMTCTKNQYSSIKNTLEQYRMILSRTGEIVFEWDIQKDTILFSEGWGPKFGYVPQTYPASGIITQSGHIHRDDTRMLLDRLKALRKGHSVQILETRIGKRDGSWLWCKVQASGIYDDKGNLIRILGLIVDIDNDKKERRALIELAEQDSLTSLFNARTTRKLAEQYLHACANQVQCALLVIDLDDFKEINDTHGHLFGDEVLINVSHTIRKMFRAEDIIGRIGGEEFLVLMKNVSGKEKVIARCEKLLVAIQNTTEKCKLTASIGVEIVSGGSIQYSELFTRADEALYKAKNGGKNQFRIY